MVATPLIPAGFTFSGPIYHARDITSPIAYMYLQPLCTHFALINMYLQKNPDLYMKNYFDSKPLCTHFALVNSLYVFPTTVYTLCTHQYT